LYANGSQLTSSLVDDILYGVRISIYETVDGCIVSVCCNDGFADDICDGRGGTFLAFIQTRLARAVGVVGDAAATTMRVKRVRW